MQPNVMQGIFYTQIVAGSAETTVNMRGAPLPCTVTATPLNGDSLAVTISTDGGANYVAWPAGAVTAQTACYFDYPFTNLKVACTGTGVASNFTIC